VVDDRDLVGQRVGLLEVLRGEQDRGAVVDQGAHDAPHVLALGGVQAGGRLVEEHDGRAADEARREVQPATHAAGVGAGRAVRGVLEPEPAEQLLGAGAGRAPREVEELADHDQVLRAREGVVDARVLPGEADRAADGVRLVGDVEPRDPRGPGVRAQQRREDAHRRGLAGPVGPQHPQHGAGARGQVDPRERLGGAEGLAQPLGLDGEVHRRSFRRGHAGSLGGAAHSARADRSHAAVSEVAARHRRPPGLRSGACPPAR